MIEFKKEISIGNDCCDKNIKSIYKELDRYDVDRKVVYDSIQGVLELVDNQRRLIQLQEEINYNNFHFETESLLLKINELIALYDKRMIHQFRKFSRFERNHIIEKYNLSHLLKLIGDIGDSCFVNDLYEQINCNETEMYWKLKLLNNLGLIEYNGGVISFQKNRQYKKVNDFNID